MNTFLTFLKIIAAFSLLVIMALSIVVMSFALQDLLNAGVWSEKMRHIRVLVDWGILIVGTFAGVIAFKSILDILISPKFTEEKTVVKETKLQKLKREQNEAISNQNYEKAAELRDRIQKMAK